MSETHVMEVLRTLPYHKVVLQSYASVTPKSPTEMEQDLLIQLRKEQRCYAQLFLRVIEAGMVQGCFKPQDDARVSMASVLTLLNAPLFWYQIRPDQSESFDRMVIDQLADMAVASLR
jgi:hypothetical protein